MQALLLVVITAVDGGHLDAGSIGRDCRTPSQPRLCAVDDLFLTLQQVKRTRSPVEAEEGLTRGYLMWEFAWAYSRLGDSSRANELRDEANRLLSTRDDAVHHQLKNSYALRLEQALRGFSLDKDLPHEVDQALNGLEPFMRYKVDRLRQQSLVLEPRETLDPMSGFWNTSNDGGIDPRGRDLARLRGESGRTLSTGLKQVLEVVRSEAPERRALTLDGVLDLASRLPSSQVLEFEQLVLANMQSLSDGVRVRLLTKSLKLAIRFNHQTTAERIVADLDSLLPSLPDAQQVAAAVHQQVRAQRRFGFDGRVAQRVAALRSRPASPGTQRLFITLAIAELGWRTNAAASQRALEQVLPTIGDSQVLLVERLRLERALAATASSAPEDFHLKLVLAMAPSFATISDSFSTNSHVCISAVGFVDALLVSVAEVDAAEASP